jgi:16S rRNA processing protein RimM
MGHVLAPFGVKGWVKVKVFTESVDSLLQFSVWWTRNRNTPHATWNQIQVVDAQIREYGVVALFEGVDDRTKSEQLKGLEIGISRSDFPEAEDGEYYWVDLIGLTVINTNDEVLGFITNLIETGANDVLVVENKATDTGEKIERLIPYIDSVILSVDLLKRMIIADWDLDY